MTKAEEIYHRFVNYEWNEIGEGMKVSIIKAIDEALKEGQKLPIHNVSSSEVKLKFNEFANNQQDWDSEFIKIVNDNFWDLL